MDEAETSYPEGFHNILALVGKNGVGKTTFLTAMADILDGKDYSTRDVTLIYRKSKTKEFYYLGDEPRSIQFTFNGKSTKLKSSSRIDFKNHLVFIPDGREASLSLSLSEGTVELVEFLKEQLQAPENFFTMLKIEPAARITLDVFPRSYEEISSNLKVILMARLGLAPEIEKFYSIVNDKMYELIKLNDEEKFFRLLYLKYVGVKLIKSAEDKKRSRKNFDFKETISALKEITEIAASKLHIDITHSLNNPRIISFEILKKKIKSPFFNVNFQDTDKVFEFLDSVNELREDFLFKLNLSEMSSGQEAFLFKMSKIHAGLKHADNLFGNQNGSCLVLIDEIDMFIHPDWERIILFEIQKLFKKSKHKCELIFSTHSPITLSDLQANSVVYINNISEEPFKRPDFLPLFQNIHLLLNGPFFLKETHGQMAKEFVREIVLRLEKFEKAPKSLDKKSFNELSNKIEKIGEKVVRLRLEAKLHSIVFKSISSRNKKLAESYLSKVQQ